MLSISISLVAAFTPLIFMEGIIGRLFREFSLTLTFAIVVSTVVSLTVTPMICAHYIKEATSDRATCVACCTACLTTISRRASIAGSP